MNSARSLCATLLVLAGAATVPAGVAAPRTTVTVTARNSDATAAVRDALASAPHSGVRIVFERGTYRFSPSEAFSKYLNVTNHSNGEKRIGLPLIGFDGIEIEGNGSLFLFTGAMMPLLIEQSRKVTVRNLTIDWPVPFFVQGEVVATDPARGTYDLRMYEKGYAWEIMHGRLRFPAGQEFTYSAVGESLCFDPVTHGPVYDAGSVDIHRKDDVRAERLPDGLVRITEKQKTYPPVGSVMTFKGPMGENRYAPAVHCLDSEGVILENVTVHHALGMGLLGERSTDITLRRFDVVVPQGSDRMISATADATHFCNCRGNVLIENCRMENMLDDGTNVHGTYLLVEKILGTDRLEARTVHYQQEGFVFGRPGDKVWFLLAPNPSRGPVNTIRSFEAKQGAMCEVAFVAPLPAGLKPGDVLENKTWNTSSFVLRGCTIRNHRARNIVLKAPGRVVIEDNDLQSMMASILVRGEMDHWYESGASEDVLIRGNRFTNCVLGGGNFGVIHIQPRLNKRYDPTRLFDRNIRIEGNTFTGFSTPAVFATTVDGLSITDNNVVMTSDYKSFDPARPVFEITRSRGVSVTGNSLTGRPAEAMSLDAVSMQGARKGHNSWQR